MPQTRKLTWQAVSMPPPWTKFGIIDEITAVLYVLKCPRMAVTCSTSSSGRCGGVFDAAHAQIDLASSEHATAMGQLWHHRRGHRSALYVLMCSRMAVTCSTSSSGRCGGVFDAARAQVDLASSEHDRHGQFCINEEIAAVLVCVEALTHGCHVLNVWNRKMRRRL